MTTIVAVNNSPAQVFQLRLLLESFQEHNFESPVHILVFLMPEEQPYAEWSQLKDYNCETFFYRGDEQTMADIRTYTNIQRVFSLRAHFTNHTTLGPVLYLDSDILLLKPLELGTLLEDEICYGSDINSYSNWSYYFESKIGQIKPELVEQYIEGDPIGDMVRECGLEPQVMKKFNNDTSGVHYLLKGFTKDSWGRVYKNTMYIARQLDLINQTFIMGDTYIERDNRGFQKYCADILATHIEIWSQGRETKIAQELNFIWPGEPIETLKNFHWFHNAGISPGDKDFFYKGKYVPTKIMPYYPTERQYIDDLFIKTNKVAQNIYLQKIIELRNKFYYVK